MIAVEWVDALGGAVTAAVAVVVAAIGYVGVRGSTASATAQWLVSELRTEVLERDEKIGELGDVLLAREARIQRLEQHVRVVEAEHQDTRNLIDLIMGTLRELLTVDQYESLQAKIEGRNPG